jgi:hypothetical protein
VKQCEAQVDCYALLQCFENCGKEVPSIVMTLIRAKT